MDISISNHMNFSLIVFYQSKTNFIFHFILRLLHLQDGIPKTHPIPLFKANLLLVQNYPSSNQMALRILAPFLHCEDLRNMDALNIILQCISFQD